MVCPCMRAAGWWARAGWLVIAGSFVGYILAGFIHDALGRRPAFTLYFLGSAAAIVAFVTIPIDGSFTTYAVSFFLGFFASGQAAGYGSFLAELFPSNMRAAGQGLAYNVGRGLAALGPGFIGITADEIGLGESIVIVGLVACSLAITCCWLLPETRGRVIVEEERQRGAEPRVAQPTAVS